MHQLGEVARQLEEMASMETDDLSHVISELEALVFRIEKLRDEL
jgi:hypothetical protein